MEAIEPFVLRVAAAGGCIESEAARITRRLSDMAGFYHDQDAYAAMLAQDDPVVYEVVEAQVPEVEGHVRCGMTILYPGRVGDEYFMTKGHFHEKPGTGEVYYGLSGSGMMLLQTRQGDWRTLSVGLGTLAYVPPDWGHRSVNTGVEPLVLFFAYPGDAGHDYDTIAAGGFVRLVVERGGGPAVEENPGPAARNRR